MIGAVIPQSGILMKATDPPPQTSPARATGTARGTIGWREWVSLPELGIPAIKAKVDTGARTSALHAFRIETFAQNGVEHVRFWLHPLRHKRGIEIRCEAPVTARRVVKDSGGHAEERYIIETPVRVGQHTWNIEISLTGREEMMFRMLLGRKAVAAAGMLIDPAASYATGRDLAGVYKTRHNRDRK